MKQLNKTIAIVGRFNFPTGDAASTRVIGVGKILKNLGYEVVFIGKCMRPKDQSCISGNYLGFTYYNVPNKPAIISRIRQIIFSGKMTISILKKNNINPDIIIYYGNSSFYLKPLLKYRMTKKITLITDLVEWYDPRQVNGGIFNPMLWDVNYTIKKLIPKCDGVITISSFLQAYYDKQGLNTVRIPQLYDIDDAKWTKKNTTPFFENTLNLVYAGTPGKKDAIDIIIKSLKKITEQGFSIKLHLFGPSRKQIEAVLANDKTLLNDLNDAIIFHGRINQDEIPMNLARADFSVLIRPNMRYAHAGFPTKFVESLAAGVPVIANLTSDLNLYLHDEQNGYIVEDNSVKALTETFTKALKLNKVSKIKMKENALNEAFNSFYYKKHITKMNDFLCSIIKN